MQLIDGMDIEGIWVDAINSRVLSKVLFSTEVTCYKTFKKKFGKDNQRSHSKIQILTYCVDQTNNSYKEIIKNNYPKGDVLILN